MAKNENEPARKEQRERSPEEPREEPLFDQEVSEGKALVEKAGEKARKKFGKKAEDRLRELRGR